MGVLHAHPQWVGGSALEHFAPGRQVLHGVPFDVIDQSQNNNRAAVVPQSKTVRESFGQPIPAEINVPVDQPAGALYFLHAAGWARSGGPVGRYTVVYNDGTREAIHLAAPAADSAGAPHANILDWYAVAGSDPVRSDAAKPLIVIDEKEPLYYRRYLYTLRWQNPHPNKPIASIVVEGDPNASATLLVLAITAERGS